MNYWEEKQTYIDGIPCQYLCHVQETTEAGIVYPAHYHYYIEILYALSGTYRVYLNGTYHEFTTGDLVLINSKEVHQIDALSKDGGKYIVVRFLPELIYNSMSSSHFEFKYIFPFITENAGYEKIIRSGALSGSLIPERLMEIMRENEEEQYGHELAIRNHISSIFLWILRFWHKRGNEPVIKNSTDRQLQIQLAPALTYVTDHYEKPIKASDMAKLCNLSYSYFSRSFNRLMNMNFSEYLNYIRIREAEKLLISTNMTVTEVAVGVGFSTTSYFIKTFKTYKNVSPKQYQKQLNFSS